jgi:single-strand DNA-binding protein
MLPTLTIVGGVYEDPALRFAPSGKSWVTVKVVVKDRKKDTNGQWVDGEAWFVRVKAFGDLAENIANSVTRGDTILVEGRLQIDKWETQDGQERTSYDLLAENVGLSLRWSTYTRDEAQAGAQATRSSPSRQQDDSPPF